MRRFLTMGLIFALLFSASILLAQRSFREPNPANSHNSFRTSGESFRTSQGDRGEREVNSYRHEASTSNRGNDNYEMKSEYNQRQMDRIRDR